MGHDRITTPPGPKPEKANTSTGIKQYVPPTDLPRVPPTQQPFLSPLPPYDDPFSNVFSWSQAPEKNYINDLPEGPHTVTLNDNLQVTLQNNTNESDDDLIQLPPEQGGHHIYLNQDGSVARASVPNGQDRPYTLNLAEALRNRVFEALRNNAQTTESSVSNARPPRHIDKKAN
jgi:hypothetical protein